MSAARGRRRTSSPRSTTRSGPAPCGAMVSDSRLRKAQVGALPLIPGQLIVRLRQRDQPAFEALAERARRSGAARGLRGQRLHGGERVLDPVIELVDQELLALLGEL
ncbi:MAG: hypothetical protein P8Z80_20980 [Pseudolabrys sp.]